MTLDEVIADVAARLDGMIEQGRHRFEQSLISNQAPADRLEDLLDDADDRWRVWRSQTLADLRQTLEARH